MSLPVSLIDNRASGLLTEIILSLNGLTESFPLSEDSIIFTEQNSFRVELEGVKSFFQGLLNVNIRSIYGSFFPLSDDENKVKNLPQGIQLSELHIEGDSLNTKVKISIQCRGQTGILSLESDDLQGVDNSLFSMIEGFMVSDHVSRIQEFIQQGSERISEQISPSSERDQESQVSRDPCLSSDPKLLLKSAQYHFQDGPKAYVSMNLSLRYCSTFLLADSLVLRSVDLLSKHDPNLSEPISVEFRGEVLPREAGEEKKPGEKEAEGEMPITDNPETSSSFSTVAPKEEIKAPRFLLNGLFTKHFVLHSDSTPDDVSATLLTVPVSLYSILLFFSRELRLDGYGLLEDIFSNTLLSGLDISFNMRERRIKRLKFSVKNDKEFSFLHGLMQVHSLSSSFLFDLEKDRLDAHVEGLLQLSETNGPLFRFSVEPCLETSAGWRSLDWGLAASYIPHDAQCETKDKDLPLPHSSVAILSDSPSLPSGLTSLGLMNILSRQLGLSPEAVRWAEDIFSPFLVRELHQLSLAARRTEGTLKLSFQSSVLLNDTEVSSALALSLPWLSLLSSPTELISASISASQPALGLAFILAIPKKENFFSNYFSKTINYFIENFLINFLEKKIKIFLILNQKNNNKICFNVLKNSKNFSDKQFLSLDEKLKKKKFNNFFGFFIKSQLKILNDLLSDGARPELSLSVDSALSSPSVSLSSLPLRFSGVGTGSSLDVEIDGVMESESEDFIVFCDALRLKELSVRFKTTLPLSPTPGPYLSPPVTGILLAKKVQLRHGSYTSPLLSGFLRGDFSLSKLSLSLGMRVEHWRRPFDCGFLYAREATMAGKVSLRGQQVCPEYLYTSTDFFIIPHESRHLFDTAESAETFLAQTHPTNQTAEPSLKQCNSLSFRGQLGVGLSENFTGFFVSILIRGLRLRQLLCDVSEGRHDLEALDGVRVELLELVHTVGPVRPLLAEVQEGFRDPHGQIPIPKTEETKKLNLLSLSNQVGSRLLDSCMEQISGGFTLLCGGFVNLFGYRAFIRTHLLLNTVTLLGALEEINFSGFLVIGSFENIFGEDSQDLPGVRAIRHDVQKFHSDQDFKIGSGLLLADKLAGRGAIYMLGMRSECDISVDDFSLHFSFVLRLREISDVKCDLALDLEHQMCSFGFRYKPSILNLSLPTVVCDGKTIIPAGVFDFAVETNLTCTLCAGKLLVKSDGFVLDIRILGHHLPVEFLEFEFQVESLNIFHKFVEHIEKHFLVRLLEQLRSNPSLLAKLAATVREVVGLVLDGTKIVIDTVSNDVKSLVTSSGNLLQEATGQVRVFNEIISGATEATLDVIDAAADTSKGVLDGGKNISNLLLDGTIRAANTAHSTLTSVGPKASRTSRKIVDHIEDLHENIQDRVEDLQEDFEEFREDVKEFKENFAEKLKDLIKNNRDKNSKE